MRLQLRPEAEEQFSRQTKGNELSGEVGSLDKTEGAMVSAHSTFMGGKLMELVVQETIGVENEDVFKLFCKLCKQLTNKFLIKEVKLTGGIALTF